MEVSCCVPNVVRVTTRDHRQTLLLGFLFSFAVVVLLGMATDQRWPVTSAFDGPSAAIREWGAGQAWLVDPLRSVERLFGTDGMRVATAVLAGWLLLRLRLRAAVLVVAVMVATQELTHFAKAFFGRDRPAWQETDHLLQSGSFPSAHASGVAAFAALVVLLVVLESRSAALRRTVGASAALVVLLVCADRLLLGRHYPTDLLGGILLGGGLAMLGMAFLQPLSRGTREAERDATRTDGAPSRRELEVSRSA